MQDCWYMFKYNVSLKTKRQSFSLNGKYSCIHAFMCGSHKINVHLLNTLFILLITCPTHGTIVAQQVFSAFDQLVVAAAAHVCK